METPWKHIMLLIAALLLLAPIADALEIEHPHSFSIFKRGVMLGDVSYSYASTDMGSPESGRYKTVTVIKNIAVPKPTSTMFSDRSEHFYDKSDSTVVAGSGHGQKKRTQVEYWPPRDDHQQQQHTLQKPEPESFKISNTRRPYEGRHNQRHRPEAVVVMSKSSIIPPATKEQVQEEPKHPVELLELAKSAVETLHQKAKVGGSNTGPVTFPVDAMMQKKMNGIVSVAKEYTSILTADPKNQRQPIASKLRTKVDHPPTKPTSASRQPTYSSSSAASGQEIPLKQFEQSEYVFNHKTGTFEFSAASKAPKAVQEYLQAGPYGSYREEEEMSSQDGESSIGFSLSQALPTNTYSSPSELLFAELQNAVMTRNVTMIKSLAGQLEETINVGKIDFESLKTNDYVDRRATEEPSMAETTTEQRRFDFAYGYNADTTTGNYEEEEEEEQSASEAVVASTTIKAPSPPASSSTKKPLRYIAPKLRGFKRFSSKRQSS